MSDKPLLHYHYCVLHSAPGQTNYMDGVVQVDVPVNADNWSAFKAMIGGNIGLGPAHFVVLSISLLPQAPAE